MLRALFEEVRENCSKEVWSNGIGLSRSGDIAIERSSEEEITLRVGDTEKLIGQVVSLYLGDTDWTCNCSLPQDPCKHVVAAVVALKVAREKGVELSAGRPESYVLKYRFESEGSSLCFRRYLLSASGEEVAFHDSLSALVSGRKKGPNIVSTDLDLKVDYAIEHERSARISAGGMKKLFKALHGQEGLLLDDTAVCVEHDLVGLSLKIERIPRGYQVKGGPDPRIDKSFENGVALIEGRLYLAGIPDLSERELQIMRGEKRFYGEEADVFISEDLPRLCKKVFVTGDVDVYDETVKEKPWVRLKCNTQTGGVSLESELVYGEPPIAVVRQGRLILEGAEKLPVRQVEWERQVSEDYFRRYGLRVGETICKQGDEAVELIQRLKSKGVASDLKLNQLLKDEELQPSIKMDGEILDASFLLDGKRVVDAGVVLSRFENGEDWVPLEGGGFARLPLSWMRENGAKLRDLLGAQSEGACIPKSLAFTCAQLVEDPPAYIREIKESIQIFEHEHFQLPGDLEASLRPYQKEGYGWLCNLKKLGLGAVLCDEMGLGKTLQTIAALEPGSLVVVPASLITNWAEELEKFRPSFSVNIFHGSSKNWIETDVILTSYHTLRLNIGNFIEREWSVVVLDESHSIKNPNSRLAEAVWKLKARFKVALTGTPIENRLADLWSQFHFALPGLLGSLESFKRNYDQPIQQGDAQIAAHLQERVNPFMLKRTKKDVAKELPARTEVIERVSLGKEQRQVYQGIWEAARQGAKDTEGTSFLFTSLLRLRQAACATALLGNEWGDHAAKIDWLEERIPGILAAGSQVLIFSQWTSFLDLLEERFVHLGVHGFRIDGSTTNRQEVVNAFQRGEKPILFISLKAGGVGLNLTAADHVFLMDPWWNPAAEKQAGDRAHRIGQERPVFVHKVVAMDTVEERVLGLQKRKLELAESVAGAELANAALAKEDLMSLFD